MTDAEAHLWRDTQSLELLAKSQLGDVLVAIDKNTRERIIGVIVGLNIPQDNHTVDLQVSEDEGAPGTPFCICHYWFELPVSEKLITDYQQLQHSDG